jgi:hypothetical protein
VNHGLPPNARLAMGDWAGAFSYIANRPVIQTEGLVNSPHYLVALKNGSVASALLEDQVGYYVKIGSVGEITRSEDCHVWLEPIYGHGAKGRIRVCDVDLVYDSGFSGANQVRIWRYRGGE